MENPETAEKIRPVGGEIAVQKFPGYKQLSCINSTFGEKIPADGSAVLKICFAFMNLSVTFAQKRNTFSPVFSQFTDLWIKVRA